MTAHLNSDDGNNGNEQRSGLRDPARAVRSAAAGVLGAEALVLLLAIQPIRVLGGTPTGAAVATAAGLAVACALLAGLLRRRWAWHLASAVQVLLVVAGAMWQPALAVLGVVFGLAWLYALRVRRTVWPA